jgi:hypothetical protein
MLVLTGVALLIIRVSYATLWGADADQNSAYKHFAIDLFGMAVHLAAAALVVRVARRYLCSRAGGVAPNQAMQPTAGRSEAASQFRTLGKGSLIAL